MGIDLDKYEHVLDKVDFKPGGGMFVDVSRPPGGVDSGTKIGALIDIGKAAIQDAYSFGDKLNDAAFGKFGGYPMPSSYGKITVPNPDPTVLTYEVGGVYLIDDGSEYAFGGVTGPRPSVYTLSIKHPQFGGSNGNGALLSLDDKGEVQYGQAFYRTQCYASLCGVKGYRIDKLIPTYKDGSVGPNQAKPKPHYTTDPDYTGELVKKSAGPPTGPQTDVPNGPGVKPGVPLGGGLGAPDLSKSGPPTRPGPGDAVTPPPPIIIVGPGGAGGAGGSGGPGGAGGGGGGPNSNSPSPTPVPIPLPNGKFPPAPPPIILPPPPPSCEDNPCLAEMAQQIAAILALVNAGDNDAATETVQISVITCDCVASSPVFKSQPLTVVKGTEDQIALQFYELATTKSQVCLSGGAGGGSSNYTSTDVPEEYVELSVPICECTNGAPVDKVLKIPVAKSRELETFAYFKQLADIIRQNCVLGTTVGISEFPATLPASLITKNDGWLGNLIPDATVEIKSVTEMIGWFVQRFDEVIGQWEQNIIIKDVDPLTPGDQPQGVVLPNISETLSEIFSMGFQTQINNDILINICTRILTETGGIKQQGFKSHGLVQTLVDYFNYEYVDKEKKMPLTFTVNETSFEKILKESEVSVAVPEYSDSETFKKSLQRLLEGAAIIKALNWRKVDTREGSNVKEQFVNVIKERAKQLKDEIDKHSTDIDSFLTEAEKGFPTLPGLPDPDMPYGESYVNRPIIKKLAEEP